MWLNQESSIPGYTNAERIGLYSRVTGRTLPLSLLLLVGVGFVHLVALGIFIYGIYAGAQAPGVGIALMLSSICIFLAGIVAYILGIRAIRKHNLAHVAHEVENKDRTVLVRPTGSMI